MKVIYIGNPIEKEILGQNKAYKYTCYADNYMQIKFMNEIHLNYKNELEIITINYLNNKMYKKAKFNGIDATFIKYNPKNSVIYYLTFMSNIFKELIKLSKKYKKEKAVIITNGPYAYYSIPVIISKLFFKFKYVCYLICSVELPQYKGIYGLVAKLSKYLIKSADATITYVEKSSTDYTNKPYLCIDFQVDEEKISLSNSFIGKHKSIKNNKINLLYTGALTYISGVKEMLELIDNLPNNYCLTLCGSGECEKEIIQYQRENPKKLHYLGLLPFKEVIKLQAQADILIVFRNKDTFINEYYSKYAGSCKIVEYLLSGKPVITNYHEALNKKYIPYLNIVDNITDDYLKNYIMKMSKKLNDSEIREKCEMGRKYVINNCIEGKQSKKIADFIKQISNNK